METIRKIFDSSLELKEGSREVIAVISTDAIDRSGEIVNAKGMTNRKNYAGNPIVLMNHQWESLPVGKVQWIKSDVDANGKGVIKAKYYVTDKTQAGRDVFGLLQDGVLSAHSIGFNSLRRSAPTTSEKNANPTLKDARVIHREWELLELSVCTVPCNPDAVAVAVAKGLNVDTLKFLNWKEGTEAAVTEQAIIEVAKPNSDQLTEAIFEATKRIKNFDVQKCVDLAIKRLRAA